MLRYFSLITSLHQRMLKQILISIGRERLAMDNHFTWPDREIRYTVIDLRTMDGEALLASPEPGDNVVAVLARLKDSSAAVCRRCRCRVSSGSANFFWIERIGRDRKRGSRSVFTIDISENKILGPIFKQGLKQGIEQGRQEVLRQQLEEKFGSTPEYVERKLQAFSDPELTSELYRLLAVPSLEDASRT